jgi:hypothetical protein
MLQIKASRFYFISFVLHFKGKNAPPDTNYLYRGFGGRRTRFSCETPVYVFKYINF